MKHKQNISFYLTTSIGNLDNTVEIEEDFETHDDLKSAIENAKNETKEHGIRTYVYHCVPLIRVDRGKLRVTKL